MNRRIEHTPQAFVRQLLFPVSLAGRRLSRRWGPWLLVGAGIAAAAGGLAAVLGGSVVTEDRALALAVSRVPEGQRALQVAYFGVPRQGGGFQALDRAVRRSLGRFGPARPIRVVQHKQTRIGGRLVVLAGIDGAGRWVRLRSGRLPRRCVPERCEVVQVGGHGAVAGAPGLRLVRVGRGTLTSALPFGRLAPATATPYGPTGYFAPGVPPPPFLLAEGVGAVSALPSLESINRAYVWVVPLARGDLHPWDVDDFVETVARTRSELQSLSFLYDVTAPVEELQAAANDGNTAQNRLLLVGGEAVALILAFALLAATGMRRGMAASWRRLTWFGARRWQLILFTTAEAASVVVVASAVGWAAGTAVTLAVAGTAGAPPWAIARHSVLSAAGLGAAALLAATTAVFLLWSLRVGSPRIGKTRLTALDVAAAAAVAAIAVGAARGDVGARSLADEPGSAAFVLLLPALVVFALAIAWARLFAPALRAVGGLARKARVGVRFAVLSLARRSGRAAIASGFFVVAVGIALFAAVYRSTLQRGQTDQAAYAVPADFIVREDLDVSKLVRPLEAAPLSRYEDAAPGVTAVPVIRQAGSVSRLSGPESLTLLGVPSGDFRRLDGWRSDFSALSLAELARRLEEGPEVELRGAPIPRSARVLLLPVSVRGDKVALSVSVLTPRGNFVGLRFGETTGPPETLRVNVPPRARGGRVVGLTFGLSLVSHETGGPNAGVILLRPLRARLAGGHEAVVSGYREWKGVNGVSVLQARTGARLRYFVTNQVVSRFRPRQPGEGAPLPIAVTPRLAEAAGAGGVLPVRLAGTQLVGRVVATVHRFPSVFGDVVLADERRLFTWLNTESPGAAFPNEIWLSAASSVGAPRFERALHRPPFDVLDVRSRAALEADLRGDPLARGTLLTLAVAAVLALALALAGLLLAVVAELRDERGELFDLESEGLAPAALRRHVEAKAATVAAFGVLGGLIAGALLAAIAADLVAVTAGARVPEPPLVLAVDWRAVGLGLLAYVGLAALLVTVATHAAFGSETPGRAEVEA